MNKLFERIGSELRKISVEYDNASQAIQATVKAVSDIAKEYDKRTNADRIRAMTDEELVDAIFKNTLRDLGEIIPFCKSHEKCSDMLDSCDGIPEHMCRECLLKWLQQPEGDVPG